MKNAPMGIHRAASVAHCTELAAGSRSNSGRAAITASGENACSTPPITHPIAACEQTDQAIGFVTRHCRRRPKNRTPSVSIVVRDSTPIATPQADPAMPNADLGNENASVAAATPVPTPVVRMYHKCTCPPSPIDIAAHAPNGTTVASRM